MQARDHARVWARVCIAMQKQAAMAKQHNQTLEEAVYSILTEFAYNVEDSFSASAREQEEQDG